MKFVDNRWFKMMRERLTFGRAALLAFVIFILFIDENSCVQQAKYDRVIKKLEQQIQAQTDTTEHYNKLIEEVKTDRELVEQIAREQYFMARPNEHIYIIEEAPSQN